MPVEFEIMPVTPPNTRGFLTSSASFFAAVLVFDISGNENLRIQLMLVWKN